MINNLLTDSYKYSHFEQYPEDTVTMCSYIEARGGAEESVFFGLQAFIKEYLMKPITKEDIDFVEPMVTQHGLPFNRPGFDQILNKHGGYLPLEIEAVPEGTVMPTSNVQLQVWNTDPNLPWLTSFIETALLRAVWYPSTVATKSREYKKMIKDSFLATSDVPWKEAIGFKLHDFGQRGATSAEAAAIGGMGHLVNFMGTDTFEAIIAAKKYYDEPMAGFSIPASEHSTITSWGKDGEEDAYMNMIRKFNGTGNIFSCVSDSYNIWNALDMWAEFEDEIKSGGGTLVVRPDSGDPVETPIEVIKRLMGHFGFTVNKMRCKVLPNYIRVIQGDGLNGVTLPKLLKRLEEERISIDNIAFGMGGGMLQKVDRDTLKYAMKANARQSADGKWHDVFKDPIGGGKISKSGRRALTRLYGIGGDTFRSPRIEDLHGENLLRTVYKNGELLIDDTLAAIRARAEIK